MRILIALLFLFAGKDLFAHEDAQCLDVRRDMAYRMQALDSAMKLRQAYLLGEIEQSAPAIRQCIEENQAVTSRAFLLWLFSNLFFVGMSIVVLWNHTVSKRAIVALSKTLHEVNPKHPANYLPTQWPMRLFYGGLALCLLLINATALLF